MIPKTIYCVWLSDKPLSDFHKKCIDTWPYPVEYITLDNCSSDSPFFQKALANKKYIHASGYLRAELLYKYGGIYLDCDVEVIKPLDDLLHTPFVGIDDTEYVNVNNAVMGMTPNHWLMKEYCDRLNTQFTGDEPLDQAHKVAGPKLLSDILNISENTLTRLDDLIVYPSEYFYPLPYTKVFSKDFLSDKTYTVHHWTHSWSYHHCSLLQLREVFEGMSGKSFSSDVSEFGNHRS
jgi:mannosyltransferase OCH1-like enzyme